MNVYIQANRVANLLDDAKIEANTVLTPSVTAYGEDVIDLAVDLDRLAMYTREDLILDGCEDEATDDNEYFSVREVVALLSEAMEYLEVEQEVIWTSDIEEIYSRHTSEVEGAVFDVYGGLSDFESIGAAMSFGVQVFVQDTARDGAYAALEAVIDELEN